MSDDQGRSPDGPPTEGAGQQPDIVSRLRAALLSAFGIKPNGSARAEIEDAIAADEAAGATLTADERTMLRAILKLGDMTVDEFKEWEHDKVDSIVGYRDKAFKSPCTGTMAPVHHTPWLEAMDDTMKTFLAVKGKAAAE